MPDRALPRRIWRLTGGVLAAVSATLLAELAWPAVAAADIALLYLVAIAAAAYTLGRLPGVLAAVSSILAYNFFFVPPYHTLYVTDTRHLITFAVMFAGGIVISGLADRGRTEAAAAESARQSARVEQVRASLLSAVSHDLRTPLATIAGAASTLATADAALTSMQRIDLAQAIETEAARMERLVSNLLDMTRLAGGPRIVRRGWFPVEELVGSALRRAEGALAGRRIEVDVPSDLPLISVDPVLVEHALRNLLENVGAHTPTGTRVHVVARRSVMGVSFVVEDSGPGLPGGDPRQWFEPFARGATAGAGGSGLGLAIVRGVADVHGGAVDAGASADGGASFTLDLPIGPIPPPTLEPT